MAKPSVPDQLYELVMGLEITAADSFSQRIRRLIQDREELTALKARLYVVLPVESQPPPEDPTVIRITPT